MGNYRNDLSNHFLSFIMGVFFIMFYVRELLLSCRNVDYDSLESEITLINHNGDELFCFRNLKDFFNAEDFNSIEKYVVSYFIARYKRLTICVSKL